MSASILDDDYELPPLLPRDEVTVRYSGVELRIEIEHESGRLGGFDLRGRGVVHGRGMPNGCGEPLTTLDAITRFATDRAREVAREVAWRQKFYDAHIDDEPAPSRWTEENSATFAARIVNAIRTLRGLTDQPSLFDGVAA